MVASTVCGSSVAGSQGSRTGFDGAADPNGTFAVRLVVGLGVTRPAVSDGPPQFPYFLGL